MKIYMRREDANPGRPGIAPRPADGSFDIQDAEIGAEAAKDANLATI